MFATVGLVQLLFGRPAIILEIWDHINKESELTLNDVGSLGLDKIRYSGFG